MYPRVINILLCLVLIVSTEAQDIKISASFDTSRIFIGDQINYSIIIDQPANVKLSLPFFKDTLCKNIDIITGPVVDTIQSENSRFKIIEKYLVTSFDSGLYQLPPVYAEMKSETGLKRYYSDYSQLEVMRVNIAPQDTTARIFDIIKPYKERITIGEIVPWVLLLVVIAAFIWVLIRLSKRFIKTKTGTEIVIKSDPAHIIAFRELESLRKETLWQKNEIKKYYTRLTEIMRQYLENRYDIASLELTTSETLEELVKSGFKKDESFTMLKSVLTNADLVKFAKYKPLPDENELNFQKSWDFVQITKASDEAINPPDGSEKVKEVIV
jgi:hypothetical protein